MVGWLGGGLVVLLVNVVRFGGMVHGWSCAFVASLPLSSV